MSGRKIFLTLRRHPYSLFSSMTELRCTLKLTPHGRLVLEESDDAQELAPDLAQRLRAAFSRGPGFGLLQLGGREIGQTVPAVFSYWREFASRFLTALCTRTGVENAPPAAPEAPAAELAELSLSPPDITGAEYITPQVLRGLWNELGEAFAEEMVAAGLPLQPFLKSLNPAWNLVGRVHFNLAENRRDEEAPFAFLATYTTRLSAQARAQHLPLGQALKEYAGAANKEKLLSLLLPVQRAAERCAWLRSMVDEHEIFHPLRWTPSDALRFLQDAQELESAGVVVRMPAAWRSGRPPRPRVTATVGSQAPKGLGAEALLDFSAEVLIDGERLTKAEIDAILSQTDGLALIRGRWVEVDREKLARTIEQFRNFEQLAAREGVTFAEAMRMVAGADIAGEGPAAQDQEWAGAVAGPWLAEILRELRSPEASGRLDPGQELNGVLRPYQQTGVRWLHLLSQLGLGACLADDMGLGKTIQVLALLLMHRREVKSGRSPSLLVAPASLLSNWVAEIERFAPVLKTLVAHPSAMPADRLKALRPASFTGLDLVITSYGSLLRLPWLAEIRWQLAILDEAQAIKNPNAKQTRAAGRLQARARIALTGTPVENRLSDLWSIFDFINPGLLGSARQFSSYAKRLVERPHNPYGPLRDLIRPYVLRRLKSDKSVIADLPDKTEIKAYCQLSRKQAALYQQAVRELAKGLAETEGIERRGLVLAYLMRFKQICNHPSQWLGDGAWHEADSGKLSRLREIAEVLAARQEKALVFTQFRETTEPLAAFLGGVFGRPGLVLHGGVDVKKRKDLVKRFQEDESAPFFVLSVKAGGTGLNLTAAAHVIHFDRWWNPAVENQATDRAFRIGQTRNVFVHKFVCRGTVEEKIDELIESKKQLSTDVIEGGGELLLTEMKDEDLLRLVSLDVNAAMKEE
jgi:superfamily II DNA or RNA helicase